MSSSTRKQIQRLFQGQPLAPCHWCGKFLKETEATRDHRLPRADGGSGTLDNFVLACAPCNNERGDIPFEEYEEIWKMRRTKTITWVQSLQLIYAKKADRQRERLNESPHEKEKKRALRAKDRCDLCMKEGCNPGNHRITWMHEEYCPWCWALVCTPEVHVEGLKRV